MNDVGFFFFT